MGKELGKRLGGESGLEGREKALFGAVGRLREFSGFLGRFGGSESHLRRLSIGLAIF